MSAPSSVRSSIRTSRRIAPPAPQAHPVTARSGDDAAQARSLERPARALDDDPGPGGAVGDRRGPSTTRPVSVNRCSTGSSSTGAPGGDGSVTLAADRLGGAGTTARRHADRAAGRSAVARRGAPGARPSRLRRARFAAGFLPAGCLAAGFLLAAGALAAGRLPAAFFGAGLWSPAGRPSPASPPSFASSSGRRPRRAGHGAAVPAAVVGPGSRRSRRRGRRSRRCAGRRGPTGRARARGRRSGRRRVGRGSCGR